jgi:hypothetical protein
MPRKARGVSWERVEPGESLLADGKHGLMFLYMCGRELERQVHETCFVSITGSLKALRFPRYVFSQALNALVCYISRANSNPPAGPDLPSLGSLTRVLVRLLISTLAALKIHPSWSHPQTQGALSIHLRKCRGWRK